MKIFIAEEATFKYGAAKWSFQQSNAPIFRQLLNNNENGIHLYTIKL
jgi:hypothetical protein